MWQAWMRLSRDVTLLGFEAQEVIALRMLRLASGGPVAEAEMNRMVDEKVTAFVEAAATLATGGAAEHVVSRLRRKVRANGRRLRR
ncbi:MAG: hypothetical protein KF735_04600 [Chelatococcus sp.]|jgi:hypothetical protein|uniref:hypothetical protein n=1 Tax=unclassified Chelatococcus TaxID=2638111 RepID=UPI001BCC0319|nr:MULTISPECIES: hypothetical protein [unclassified Chelatococcus]CAH1662360.1 conserved hypothetical protein [Hyphomicrobiales bacterium]MBS7741375.1 hypothetical protein [Chelatococcus sp. HY11]MBX3536890.1 hypothetical protein [Chelatococcus sp.]MBX3546143.1 hypothetical protein [Chelatococcus sp.]MCO5077208.1 hypothetical protein [Chelatococcus sp.]